MLSLVVKLFFMGVAGLAVMTVVDIAFGGDLGLFRVIATGSLLVSAFYYLSDNTTMLQGTSYTLYHARQFVLFGAIGVVITLLYEAVTARRGRKPMHRSQAEWDEFTDSTRTPRIAWRTGLWLMSLFNLFAVPYIWFSIV